MTTDEKIKEGQRIAEYAAQDVHAPEYRTSLALTSLALFASALFDMVPVGAAEDFKTELGTMYELSKLKQADKDAE